MSEGNFNLLACECIYQLFHTFCRLAISMIGLILLIFGTVIRYMVPMHVKYHLALCEYFSKVCLLGRSQKRMG